MKDVLMYVFIFMKELITRQALKWMRILKSFLFHFKNCKSKLGTLYADGWLTMRVQDTSVA